MSNREQLIIVTHPIHAEIDERQVRALVEAEYSIVGFEEVRPARLTLEATDCVDWVEIANAQRRTWDTNVKPLLDRYPTAKVAYFGLAPIPLAIHLGSLTERFRELRIFQRHHVTRRWEYAGGKGPSVVPAQGASDTVHSDDPVVITVSTTTRVHVHEARKHVGSNSAELHVATDPLGEDVLASEASIVAVANAFREALERVEANRPQAAEIHLFAAVPTGLAFLLGSHITPTRHARVVTYQYYRSSDPRFREALRIASRASATAALTAEQRVEAAAVLEEWERERQRVVEVFERYTGPCWEFLGPLARPFESGAFSKLQALRDTPLRSPVVRNVEELDGEFRYDSVAHQWVLADGLVAAIREALPQEKLARAGRMLLLHEALHHGVQNLDGGSANRIRLAPKVLEELDYLADTWAMMHEFVLAGLVPAVWNEQRLGLLDIIETAVATMWAFDANSERGVLEIRRVNRYLIWYVQLARIEQARSAEEAMAIMAEKPTVELIGPRAQLRDGRYILLLDRPSAVEDELCFLDLQGRLRRLGTTNACSVSVVSRALGNHSGGEVRAAVRALIGRHP